MKGYAFDRQMAEWVWLFWVFIGAFLIATGGIVTTLGWNKHNQMNARKGLIKAVAREWQLNTARASEWNEVDPDKGGEEYLARLRFQNFKGAALNAATTSDLLRKNDELLLGTVEEYEIAISDLNARNARRERYSKEHLLESPEYEAFRKSHAELGSLLEKEFAWSLRR